MASNGVVIASLIEKTSSKINKDHLNRQGVSNLLVNSSGLIKTLHGDPVMWQLNGATVNSAGTFFAGSGAKTIKAGFSVFRPDKHLTFSCIASSGAPKCSIGTGQLVDMIKLDNNLYYQTFAVYGVKDTHLNIYLPSGGDMTLPCLVTGYEPAIGSGEDIGISKARCRAYYVSGSGIWTNSTNAAALGVRCWMDKPSHYRINLDCQFGWVSPHKNIQYRGKRGWGEISAYTIPQGGGSPSYDYDTVRHRGYRSNGQWYFEVHDSSGKSSLGLEEFAYYNETFARSSYR